MAGSNFEVQLGQLADAEINQNAPSLTPYKVGFQLIDKDDDDTKGVGVSVYKINNQWAYIPVFFINSRLRGLDLMYLPEKSQFVPCKENWISYLKGQQPNVLGEVADKKNTIAKGKPNTVRLWDRMDPFFKSAALLEDDAVNDMLQPVAGGKDATSLKKWLPAFGKQAVADFTMSMQKHPDFANAILRFYTPEDLLGMAKQAEERSASARGATELKVITPDDPDASKLLDSEKEALMKDKIFVIDNRKETSTVFSGDINHKNVKTPSEPGLYDMLMGDGSFNRFYVIIPRKRAEMTGGNQRNSNTAKFILVPMNAKDKYIEGDITMQGTKLDQSNEDEQKLLDELGRSAGLITKERDNYVVLTDKKGNAYELHFNGPKVAVGAKISVSMAYGRSHDKIKYLEFTEKDGEMFVGGDTIYVPKNAKVIVKADQSKRDSYSFGNPNTLFSTMINKVNLKPLKVYSDGTSVTFSSGSDLSNKGPMNKSAALLHLITVHGINAPTAKRMVKEASAGNRPGVVRYLVKYADNVSQVTEGTSAGVGRAPYIETKTPVGGMPLDDIKSAVAASDAGIQEVMDVSVLKALAKNSRALDMVDDYLADLFLAMDRVGRLLFLFYWHNEKFKSRYGSDEMTELEDTLRDAFHIMSDLILFLSKKTISPNSVMDGLTGDISDDLGA